MGLSVVYWITITMNPMIFAARMILFLLDLSVRSPATNAIPAEANKETERKKPMKSSGNPASLR